MRKAWHYVFDGGRYGPVPQEHLLRLILLGDLAPDVSVWAEGMTHWCAATQVPELVSSIPPPLPTAVKEDEGSIDIELDAPEVDARPHEPAVQAAPPKQADRSRVMASARAVLAEWDLEQALTAADDPGLWLAVLHHYWGYTQPARQFFCALSTSPRADSAPGEDLQATRDDTRSRSWTFRHEAVPATDWLPAERMIKSVSVDVSAADGERREGHWLLVCRPTAGMERTEVTSEIVEPLFLSGETCEWHWDAPKDVWAKGVVIRSWARPRLDRVMDVVRTWGLDGVMTGEDDPLLWASVLLRYWGTPAEDRAFDLLRFQVSPGGVPRKGVVLDELAAVFQVAATAFRFEKADGGRLIARPDTGEEDHDDDSPAPQRLTVGRPSSSRQDVAVTVGRDFRGLSGGGASYRWECLDGRWREAEETLSWVS